MVKKLEKPEYGIRINFQIRKLGETARKVGYVGPNNDVWEMMLPCKMNGCDDLKELQREKETRIKSNKFYRWLSELDPKIRQKVERLAESVKKIIDSELLKLSANPDSAIDPELRFALQQANDMDKVIRSTEDGSPVPYLHRKYKGITDQEKTSMELSYWAIALSTMRDNQLIIGTGKHTDIESTLPPEGISMWLRDDTPTYFVSRRIYQALVKTDIIEDLEFSELESIPWVMHNMLLVLPTPFISDSGMEVHSLLLARADSDHYARLAYYLREELNLKSWLPTQQDLHKECVIGDVFVYAIGVIPKEGLLVETSVRSESPIMCLTKDSPTCPVILTLAYSLLRITSDRPHLVEVGSSIRKSGKKPSRHSPEYWNPNRIGRAYRVGGASGGDGEGTGKRFHWRSGHWRNQRYGRGRQQVKRIWIEPMMIWGKE